MAGSAPKSNIIDHFLLRRPALAGPDASPPVTTERAFSWKKAEMTQNQRQPVSVLDKHAQTEIAVNLQPLMSEKDAAALLAVSVKSLQRWRVTGGGPQFVKMGSRVVYRPFDLEAFIASRVRSSTSDRGGAQ